MTWNEYVEQVKASDPNAYKILDVAKEEADIISAMIEQRTALGLSQRDLASLCNIPQSSVARIESYKSNPKLTTLIKIFDQLGLALTVTQTQAPK